MKGKRDDFDQLMGELVRQEGPRLLRENAAWQKRVPERADKKARALIASLAVGTALIPAAKGGGRFARRVMLPAVAGVTATAVLAGGALLAVPGMRECFDQWLSPGAESGVTATAPASRGPGEYRIPTPGEEFTVRESAESETLQYVWFEAGERAALVEIAYRLPEDARVPENAEPVAVGSLLGFCYRIDAAWYLTLTDGNVSVLISLKNAEREALIDYAALFAAANGL